MQQNTESKKILCRICYLMEGKLKKAREEKEMIDDYDQEVAKRLKSFLNNFFFEKFTQAGNLQNLSYRGRKSEVCMLSSTLGATQVKLEKGEQKVKVQSQYRVGMVVGYWVGLTLI